MPPITGTVQRLFSTAPGRSVVWLLEHVPVPPPDWLGFCFRTWLAIVLALAAAFWLQLDSPSSAAVCVAILAQPSRGQSLSKAVYRMGGTVLGAVVAVVLAALFPQDRFMLLGGIAFWLALCTFVATMLRDFRAYGAVLSGYTVAIVGLTEIDTPLDTFENAVSRVAVIALGIIATMLVNDLFGSPETWTQLAHSLDTLATKAFGIADDARDGRPIPDEGEITSLGNSILALKTQASYARTELADGRQRIMAANSAILALLDLLRASRAIAHIPDRILPENSPGAIFLADRTAALARHRGWAEQGMRVLADGGTPARRIVLRTHRDLFAGGLNATRILIAFVLGAAFSILSGLSDSTLALVQVSAVCALAATNPNPTSFAFGLIIGAPLAVICAGLVNFFLLNQGSAMVLLAVSLLPVVLVGCSLSMNAKTGTVGFIMLVFTIVLLSPANQQSFDLSAFAERSVMFIAAAVIVFLALVLVLPVSPRRRLMRGMTATVAELRAVLDGRLDAGGSGNAGRRYDRLTQIAAWNAQIGPAGSRRFVLARAVALNDLTAAVIRSRRALRRARAVPDLHDAAREAEARLAGVGVGTLGSLEQATTDLAAQGRDLAPAEADLMRSAVSGLYGAGLLLRDNQRMLTLTGVIGPSR